MSKNDQYKDHTLETYYVKNDLSQLPIFGAGFINFGYWKDLDFESSPIPDQIRERSCQQLYEAVLNKLGIDSTDMILEVGCGVGTGAVLLSKLHNPSSINGVDIFQEQVERALINSQNLSNDKTKLEFKQGAAENLPFEDSSFSKVYSVEAAQHFKSIEAFSQEVFRVLKSNGKLAFTTFFGTKIDSNEQLRDKMLSIKGGADTLYFIDFVLDNLKKAGFKNVEKESIGNYVFFGWDKWLTQTIIDDYTAWGKYWLLAFKNKTIDYYLITAQK